MDYIKCKSCGKPIASFDSSKTKTIELHIQCKSCKIYNVINNNKVDRVYAKIGKKEG